MQKETNLDRVQIEMTNLVCDVRIETQLVMAMENGLKPEEFVVNPDGLFTREYSRDLILADIIEDARKIPFLELHISRNGIYNQLPEGGFFQHSESKKRSMAAVDMAAEYKENKKREKEIKRFFLPFDNDFFWQRIQMEKEESRLLEGLQSGILNDYFVEFWNIPRSIPRKFITPLILLLPYAHRIAGDLPLTEDCLEQLLAEEVRIIQKRSFVNLSVSVFSPGLGEAQLGLNMLCGEEFWEDSPMFTFEIGALEKSVINDYLEGGNRFELLEIFRRFFIPAGFDVEFEVKVTKANQHMMMEKDNGPVLGYSSVL